MISTASKPKPVLNWKGFSNGSINYIDQESQVSPDHRLHFLQIRPGEHGAKISSAFANSLLMLHSKDRRRWYGKIVISRSFHEFSRLTVQLRNYGFIRKGELIRRDPNHRAVLIMKLVN